MPSLNDEQRTWMEHNNIIFYFFISKSKGFDLFCTTLLEGQVPINLHNAVTSVAAFLKTCLWMQSYNLVITLAQVFGHTQNSLLIRS